MVRDDAYRLVQENAQRAWDDADAVPRACCEAAVAGSDVEVDLDAVFDPTAYLAHAGEVFERLEALR